MERIFREYDIRGIVGRDLTPEIAENLGRAFGTVIRRKQLSRIAVGRDGRESSPVMFEYLVRGLNAAGIGVTDIGVCPTPVLYYSLFQLPVDGGVMITASHNPGEYNGFKLSVGKESLYGEDLQKLRRMIEREDYEKGKGPPTKSHRIIPEYMNLMKEIKEDTNRWRNTPH